MYDPKYRIKHKVTPITRLRHYDRRLPMVGDGTYNMLGFQYGDIHKQLRILYKAAMAQKKGLVPGIAQKGLWAWL